MGLNVLGADGKVRVLKLQRKTNTDPEKLPVRTIRLPTRSCTICCLLFAVCCLRTLSVWLSSMLTVCVLLSLRRSGR